MKDIYSVIDIYIIKRMKVSNAINILNSSIDNKICKNNSTDKCKQAAADSSDITTNFQLSQVFKEGYTGKETEKFGATNARLVSTDTAALTREEKGVVSSVFAKVIEGAEILEIRSILESQY